MDQHRGEYQEPEERIGRRNRGLSITCDSERQDSGPLICNLAGLSYMKQELNVYTCRLNNNGVRK